MELLLRENQTEKTMQNAMEPGMISSSILTLKQTYTTALNP